MNFIDYFTDKVRSNTEYIREWRASRKKTHEANLAAWEECDAQKDQDALSMLQDPTRSSSWGNAEVVEVNQS
jgi:hypothetical protein